MIGARKLLTRHTQGRRIQYTTPYEGVYGVVITPPDYYYNDGALLEALAFMPNGITKKRMFWSYTNAQNYVESCLIASIRQLRSDRRFKGRE